MLITNECDRPVRPSSTSEKYDRAAGGWSAGYVVIYRCERVPYVSFDRTKWCIYYRDWIMCEILTAINYR